MHLTTHLTIAAASHPGPISTFQAIVLGVLQGITELFPVSSLGHTVLFPTLFGWNSLVKAQSNPESFWLAFVVMLHVGSAVGLGLAFEHPIRVALAKPSTAAIFLTLNGVVLLAAERLRRRAQIQQQWPDTYPWRFSCGISRRAISHRSGSTAYCSAARWWFTPPSTDGSAVRR